MPSKVRPQSVTETIFIRLRYYVLRINKLLNSYWSIFQIVSCDACTLYIICAAILNCRCRGSLGREWFRTLIPCSCWNAIRTADKLCCFFGWKIVGTRNSRPFISQMELRIMDRVFKKLQRRNAWSKVAWGILRWRFRRNRDRNKWQPLQETQTSDPWTMWKTAMPSRVVHSAGWTGWWLVVFGTFIIKSYTLVATWSILFETFLGCQ